MRRRTGRAEDGALELFDRVTAPAIGTVAALAMALETVSPLRARTTPRGRRWKANAALGAIAAPLARFAVLPAMVLTATATRGGGLLGRLRLPKPLRRLIAFALLDYSVYGWHRANHRIAFLWRFHAAHHVDPDVDVTTAFRFHLGELLLSIPVRCVIVAALGVTPREVVLYECAMQAVATFHHANMRLPRGLESALSNVFITPSLHGTHHSDRPAHLSSNWGVVLSIWDRLHSTRRIADQQSVRIGIPFQPSVETATDPLRVLLLPAAAQSMEPMSEAPVG